MRGHRSCAALLWIGALLLPCMVHAADAAPKVLTLQDAERMALENHPGIRAATERVKVQEAVVQRAWAGYVPTLSARGEYENRTVESRLADRNLYNTTGAVSWLVTDFGRREGSIRREENTLDARRFARLTSVEEVLFTVRRFFFEYLRAEALVRVEQDTVKDREALVRQARGFFDVGTRPKIDVARAEASLFAAKADLIGAQNGVRIAWARLKNAMGLTRFEQRPVAAEVNVQPTALSLEDAVQAAFESRTEIKDFRSRLDAGQEAIEVARKARLPKIQFDGQYGWLWHNERDVVRSSLTLTVPLFAEFTIRPDIERNVREYHAIKAQQDEQRQRIALEVE